MTPDSITEVTEPIPASDTEDANTPSPITAAIDVLNRLTAAVKQQVLGRDDVIELTLIALVADGHVLLEDFPGSGKTTLAKALGEAIIDDGKDSDRDEFILPFRRIQFTPTYYPQM